MTNNGLKTGVSSQTEAENYLKYLDGTAYTHIPGILYSFNDISGPNPFRIIVNSDGNLALFDAPASREFDVLCQYDCRRGRGK